MNTIKDGSAVLAHDAFDVRTWTNAHQRHQSKKPSTKLATQDALLRDLFWSYNQHQPVIKPATSLTEAHSIHERIMRGVLQTREHEEIREAGTVGDTLTSALAAFRTLPKLVEALPADTLKDLSALHKIEAQLDLIEKEMALFDMHGQVRKHRQAKTKWERVTKKGEKIAAKIAKMAPDDIQNKARRAARKAQQGIQEAVEAYKASTDMFGLNEGAEGIADAKGLGFSEKLSLTHRIINSSKLHQIAQMCGRMTRIAMQIQAEKTKEPTEIVGIRRGADIARLLPTELALLAIPELEDLFYLKLAEKKMLQYNLEGKEPKGKGPLIIALDSSGSMSGQREIWSKAIALSLLLIAKKQKRDCAIIHFSDGERTYTFPNGHAPASKLVECTEYFEAGGTNFDSWIDKALALVDQSEYEKADTIIISDGDAHLSTIKEQAWQKRRKERQMKTISILIGDEGGEKRLKSISDYFFKMDDLTDDQAILQQVFSV